MKRTLQLTFVVLGMVVGLAACSSNNKAATTTTTTKAKATTTTVAGPKMTITPNTGLTNGQTVSITGSKYPANEQLGITECANKGAQTGAGDCDLGAIKVTTASATGTVSATFPVALGPFGQNNIVCTAKPGCIVSVAQAGSANPNAVATANIAFS
ncbi:MAG TPA: neocarzinostatin apoprotein domain-containing protein [Acidimicrobiales bacterium]|nr:neocarzinostatin apoprotein domain-containing protein [Acidimicrobiales bacterium]